jgi:hypothetical protein
MGRSTRTIQAIETLYGGCRFRSRLEARWAVFFDALDKVWLYEPEGFVLEDDICYLPDFYLPEGKVWVEIKPLTVEGPTDDDLRKCCLLSKHKQNVVMLVGTPGDLGHDYQPIVFWHGDVMEPTGEGAHAAHSVIAMLDMGIPPGEPYEKAIAAARQARFEHGQKGPPSAWSS